MGVIAVAAYPELQRCAPPPMPQSEAAPGFTRNFESKRSGAPDRIQAAPAPSSENRAKQLSKTEKSMENAV